MYFRQFSGHTQVNVADLNMLHYPDLQTLTRLGLDIGDTFPDQRQVDKILDKEIETLAKNENSGNPLKIRGKIEEALIVLKALDLPRGQQNERSALTLLALLNLKPDNEWIDAKGPLIGITPIMDFVRDSYGKAYAPNTRETFRRQTIHQFMDAGIAIVNPDQPDRPINSPKWCYQIEPDALSLMKSFGSKEWSKNLEAYMKRRKS